MIGALKFFTSVAVLTARTFVDAWGLMMMWNWFIAPLGAVQLTLVSAIGIDLLIGMLLALSIPTQPPELTWAERTSWAAGKLVVAPTVVFLGWLVLGASA